MRPVSRTSGRPPQVVSFLMILNILFPSFGHIAATAPMSLRLRLAGPRTVFCPCLACMRVMRPVGIGPPYADPIEKRRRPRGRPWRAARLTAQLQSLDQRFVTRVVDALDIVEKTPALADHDEKAPSRMEVLLVRLHVSGQVSDAFGQDRNLHFRGTGIAGLAGEFFNERLLALGRDRHRMLLLLEI